MLTEHTRIIGSIKSLFWIGGYDELVDIVNDPAFSLHDEVQIIPGGAKIGYLVDRYYEEGLIPHYAYHHAMDDGDEVGFQHRLPIFTARINILPSVVSNDPQPRTIQSMYPLSRPQCLPQTVTCFKVKWDKKKDRLLARISGIFGELFEPNDFWFRGLSRSALTSTLAFFIPALTTKSQDNKFGPGIYTSNKLDYVLDSNNNGLQIPRFPGVVRLGTNCRGMESTGGIVDAAIFVRHQ